MLYTRPPCLPRKSKSRGACACVRACMYVNSPKIRPIALGEVYVHHRRHHHTVTVITLGEVQGTQLLHC
jgi:hypothetical protein